MDGTNKIKICYWSCRGLTHKKETLEDFLFNEDIDFCGVTETKYNPNVKQTFKGYNLFHMSQADRNEGITILAKRKFQFQEIQIKSPPEVKILGVKFQINRNQAYTVIVLYSHPSKQLNMNTLYNLIMQLQLINGNTNNIIIGGDFNAHNPAWGSNQSNGKGKTVLDFIAKHDLILLNDGSVTRIGNINQQHSAINLTIVSSNIGIDCDWITYQDAMGSDHIPILTTITTKHTTRAPTEPQKDIPNAARRQLKKADWNQYKENIQTHSNQSQIQQYQDVETLLNKGAEDAIPKSVSRTAHTHQHPNKSWWNKECEEAKKNRKQALKNFLKCGNKETYIEWKKKKCSGCQNNKNY
jgi:hypothetical protein